jgi:hypothetical protein
MIYDYFGNFLDFIDHPELGVPSGIALWRDEVIVVAIERPTGSFFSSPGENFWTIRRFWRQVWRFPAYQRSGCYGKPPLCQRHGKSSHSGFELDYTVPKWTFLLCLLVILFPSIGRANGWKNQRISLYEKDLLNPGENRRGPYFLPDSLIVDGSEKVTIDGISLPAGAYELNALAGELRFQQIVSDRSEIRIVYKKLPIAVKRSYYRNPLVQRMSGAPTQAMTPRDVSVPTEIDYASQLQRAAVLPAGSRSATTRGLKLNSSLNLNLSGKVAEQVYVNAALTDQSTPIQPEGTTQNLKEIDKVFVEIKAPHLTATLGDYVLNLQENEFTRYSRKLQGAMAEVSSNQLRLLVSGAVSKGKYISKQLSGREGYQGPYQLTGDQGQLDIIVLAGTERVYIDGETMVRGETHDYIIDYAAAQITFTRRRLITSDSRIVIDFQYSDELFRRDLYSARFESNLWKERLHFSATLLHEADDRDNPLGFALSEDRMQVLQAAGDDPNRAVGDGAVYVGSGMGRYNRDEAGIYVYAGLDSGSYQVTFSDLGSGKGAYRYKGEGVYEYVGDGFGRLLLWFCCRRLPVTISSILAVAFACCPICTWAAKPQSAGLTETPIPVERRRQSRVAQTWSLRIEPDSLRMADLNLGSLRFVGRLRKIDDRFHDIDRTTSIEYNRQWDLPVESGRGESVREAQLNYLPRPGYQFSGEYGRNQKGHDFLSRRWQLQTQINDPHVPRTQYRVERIRTNSGSQDRLSNWLRQKGDIRYPLWKITPFFTYQNEIKKENWSDSLYTGFKFDETASGIEFAGGSRLFGFCAGSMAPG